jgi:periplasmic copper chaperone A
MRRRLAMLAVSAALLVAGCGARKKEAPSIDHAWVRLPAVPGRPGAAYFRLHGGAEPARLIAIESPQVQSIELHQSMKGGTPPGAMGGMMEMAKIDGIDLPADGAVEFAPGGYHAMLFGIDPKATPGTKLQLSFRFAKGQPIAVQAKAVGAGDSAP